MMRELGALCLVAACGRFGFAPAADDHGADAGTSDATAGIQPIDVVGCHTRTAVASVAGPVDQLFWLVEPAGNWIVASLHLANTDHPLWFVKLGLDADALKVLDEGLLLQTQDATAAFVSTGSAHMLVVGELGTGGLEAIPIASAMLGAPSTSTPALGYSREPAARDGTGVIAAIGVNSGDELVAMQIEPDGTFLGSSVKVITGAAASPGFPVIRGLPSGFLVTWTAYATGTCGVALLGSDLSILASNELVVAGGCRAPFAAVFDTDRVVVAAGSGGTSSVTYAIYDLSLSEVVAPQTIAGEEPELLGDGDRAWMSWATSTGELRHGWLDRQGSLTTLPSLGTVPSISPWSHTLGVVGGGPVLMWGDANTATNTIVASRLCR